MVFSPISDLIPVVFSSMTQLLATFLPTGGYHKMGYGHLMATGGAAMGSAVATGGLPWVVSTSKHSLNEGTV